MFYPWHRACASCRQRCWNEPRAQPFGKILPTTRLLSSRPSAPHSILHPALRTLAQVSQVSVDSAQAPVMGGHPLHRCLRPSPPWSQVSNLLEQRTRRSPPFWPDRWVRGVTLLELNWRIILVCPYTFLPADPSHIVIFRTDLLARNTRMLNIFNYCKNHTAQVIALQVVKWEPKVKASGTELVTLLHILK